MADAFTSPTASDFRNASHAAGHALDAVMVAHSMILVVSLALSTEAGHVSLEGQEAVWTAASYAVEKAREARNAIDLASSMIRAEEANG